MIPRYSIVELQPHNKHAKSYLIISKDNPDDLGRVSQDLLVLDALQELQHLADAAARLHELGDAHGAPDAGSQAAQRVLQVNGELLLRVAQLVVVDFAEVFGQVEQGQQLVHDIGVEGFLQVHVVDEQGFQDADQDGEAGHGLVVAVEQLGVLDEVHDGDYGQGGVLGVDVGVLGGGVVRVVELLEGQQALGDGVWREELRVARKPLHFVHFLFESVVRAPNDVYRVYHLLINESLSEAPELIEFIYQYVKLLRILRRYVNQLMGPSLCFLGILQVDNLLLQETQLVIESLYRLFIFH